MFLFLLAFSSPQAYVSSMNIALLEETWMRIADVEGNLEWKGQEVLSPQGVTGLSNGK